MSAEQLEALVSRDNDLEEIGPEEAVDRYLRTRKDEITPSTADDYRTSLESFVEYCDEHGVNNLNNLKGRTINDYEHWRKYDSTNNVEQLATKTMRDELYLLKDFLKFLERIEGVDQGTAKKVEPPEIDAEEGVRDVELKIEYLNEVVQYLSRYEYAKRTHLVIKIAKETGRRLGGIHSLDLCDACTDVAEPYLHFRHHDDGNTRLKNGKRGEGKVNISRDLADVIEDYVENHRVDTSDDGQEPLLTTANGRLSKSTIRRYFYKWTRPCHIGQECPVGRDPEDCEAACDRNKASQCPESEAPHAARHGYITHRRRQGAPTEVLSEQCDMSEEVLKKFYDERSEEEKRKLRRKILNEVLDDEGSDVEC